MVGHESGASLWSTTETDDSRTVGINSPVTAIAISPDSARYLYGTTTVGAPDGQLGLRVAPIDGETLYYQGHHDVRSFVEQASGILGIAFAELGRMGVSATRDGIVSKWELQTEAPLGTFELQQTLACFDMCGTQHFAIVAMNSGKVALHKLSDGELVTTLSSDAPALLDVAGSSDGQFVAAAGADGQVYVWKVDGSELVAELSGHTGRVLSIDISDDGQLALSGGEDGTVRVWSVAEQRETHKFEGHTSGVTGVAFSPTASMALSGGNDRFARLWNLDE
jgi:WD40 repeat protein